MAHYYILLSFTSIRLLKKTTKGICRAVAAAKGAVSIFIETALLDLKFVFI